MILRLFRRKVVKEEAVSPTVDRLFMIALRTGSVAAVRAFLARKESLSAVDGQGRSPLIIAATHGHVELVRALIEAGADLAAEDGSGLTAADVARREGHEAVAHFIESVLEEVHPFQMESNSAETNAYSGDYLDPDRLEAIAHPTEAEERTQKPGAVDGGTSERNSHQPHISVEGSDFEEDGQFHSPILPFDRPALSPEFAARSTEGKHDHRFLTPDPASWSDVSPPGGDLNEPDDVASALAFEHDFPHSSAEPTVTDNVPGLPPMIECEVELAEVLEGLPDAASWSPTPSAASPPPLASAATIVADASGSAASEPVDTEGEGSANDDEDWAPFWEEEVSDFGLAEDNSAIVAATHAQAAVSIVVSVREEEEDWGDIVIDLPSRMTSGTDAVLPARIKEILHGTLSRGIALGEQVSCLARLPSTVTGGQARILERLLLQLSGDIGCVVDRQADRWLDVLDSEQVLPLPAEERASIDEYMSEYWHALRDANFFDRFVDDLKPLDRIEEEGLFSTILRANDDICLEMARSPLVLDFILAADRLLDEGGIAFSFISSLEVRTEDDSASERMNDEFEEAEDDSEGLLLPADYAAGLHALRQLHARCKPLTGRDLHTASTEIARLRLTSAFVEWMSMELGKREGAEACIRSLSAIQRRAAHAREMVLVRHLPFARAIAEQHVGKGLELEDLVQEANLGIMRAIETFDPERGNRFSTYAGMWCWQRITRAIADQGELIRVPVHIADVRRKTLRVLEEWPLGCPEPGVDELAEASGVAPAWIRRFQFLREVLSLNDQSFDDAEGRFLQTRDESAFDAAVRSELKLLIDSMTGELGERNAVILRRRFGLDDGEEETLEEIGQDFGVTRERIRQLEAKALEFLQHPVRARVLRSYLEA